MIVDVFFFFGWLHRKIPSIKVFVCVYFFCQQENKNLDKIKEQETYDWTIFKISKHQDDKKKNETYSFSESLCVSELVFNLSIIIRIEAFLVIILYHNKLLYCEHIHWWMRMQVFCLWEIFRMITQYGRYFFFCLHTFFFLEWVNYVAA